MDSREHENGVCFLPQVEVTFQAQTWKFYNITQNKEGMNSHSILSIIVKIEKKKIGHRMS